MDEEGDAAAASGCDQRPFCTWLHWADTEHAAAAAATPLAPLNLTTLTTAIQNSLIM